jgi:hypothetical protein
MKAVVAHSGDVDALDAALELVAKAREKLNGERPVVGLLFTAIDYEAEIILATILEAFPGIELIGCTTDGELSSELGFCEDSAVLCLIAGDEVDVACGVARQVSENPEEAISASVEETARRLGGPPRLCLTTPTSMTISDSVVVRQLRSALGQETPIFGATAADQWRFTGTRQFFGCQVLEDAVPYVLLGGDILFSFAIKPGWSPLGRTGVVTAVDGHVIKTIDEQPATEFYRHYLGNVDISQLVEYPLAIFPGESDEFYLRACESIDEADGWLHFFGDIPIGSRVQITQATRDEVLRSARETLHQARDGYPGTTPSLLLCFVCSGHKQLLGSRTVEEGRLALEVLDDVVPVVGFYGYGEIAPISAGGTTHFHNETFVALVLGTE